MTLLDDQLNDLRADFEQVNGSPFRHFYCPILHVDGKSELARCRTAGVEAVP